MVADDSSMATGWRRPGVGRLGRWPAPAPSAGRGRRPRRAPGPCRPRRAPPPAARRRGSSRPGRPTAVRDRQSPATGAGAGAGSYQRSGVTGGVSSHERAQSARGSGRGRVAVGAGGRLEPLAVRLDRPARPVRRVRAARRPRGPARRRRAGAAGVRARRAGATRRLPRRLELGRIGVALGQVAGIGGVGAGIVVHGDRQGPWVGGR